MATPSAWLRDGVTLTEAQEARLAQLGVLRRPRPQQLTLLVRPEGVGATVDVVLREIGPAALADFHVATASLEDVYVQLVGRGIQESEQDQPEDGTPTQPPASPALPASPATQELAGARVRGE